MLFAEHERIYIQRRKESARQFSSDKVGYYFVNSKKVQSKAFHPREILKEKNFVIDPSLENLGVEIVRKKKSFKSKYEKQFILLWRF